MNFSKMKNRMKSDSGDWVQMVLIIAPMLTVICWALILVNNGIAAKANQDFKENSASMCLELVKDTISDINDWNVETESKGNKEEGPIFSSRFMEYEVTIKLDSNSKMDDSKYRCVVNSDLKVESFEKLETS